MSCYLRGGSVASDAVVSQVTDGAFSKLDGQFTNLVGGKRMTKKPSTQAKTSTSSSKKTASKSRKGGMCMICGGSTQPHMKHFNDFDNSGLDKVHNKRGGSSSPLFDVKYDYSMAMSQPAHGPSINRGINFEATNLMASESVSPLGGFNKVAHYGNITDLSDGKFIYGGASKRKVVSKSKPKKDVRKPSTASKARKNPRKKQT